MASLRLALSAMRSSSARSHSLPAPAARRRPATAALVLAAALAALAFTLPASAQVQVSAEQIECIPVKRNAVITARITGEPGGSTVRLYFRRLHEEVEDFYYVVMNPSGGGEYWAVLPKPADEDLDVEELEETESAEEDEFPQAAWWKAKDASDDRDPNDDLNEEIIEERASQGRQEDRDWMKALTLEELEDWLEELENEPTEYFVQVFDADGQPISGARSATLSTVVTEDCEVDLDRRQQGQALNLVIGETAPWQIGRPVFHWLCDGIVSRIDYRDILRADEMCRACAFAMTQKLLVPATAGSVGVLGVVFSDEPEPVSPTDPDDDDQGEDEDG